MDKEKLVKGFVFISVATLIILIDATLLHIGFNNINHGSYTIFILAIIILPFIFYFAFKGIKNILDSIFEK
ncbi:MAG: hypothetical protein H8E84_08895 [Flavobacteriales bacterium]|nr:hypothetical protein [Flavobacteriales bacterium]